MSEQLLATDLQCAAAPGSDGSTVRHHGSTKPAGGGVNAWIIYATILLTAIIFAIGQFKVPPTMTAAMADLGIGLTQGGLLMSIVAITAIVLALFGGMLTVRFRPKTLAISAICCALAGNLVGYAAPSFELLLFSRLLEGLGYGLQTAIMPTIIAEIFPENKRSIPMALYSMWVSIGMLFIFNFSNVLSVSWGWRSCWLFCAALFLVALVLFAFVVKEPQDSALGADGTTWQEQKRAIGIEAKNPSIWCLTLVFTIFGLGCSAFSTFAPTFCVQALGMDPAAANTDTGFLTFGMIAGALMMTGILAVYRRSRSVLLIVATVITGVFFALSFLLNAPWQVIPFCLVNGVVLQTIPPIVFAVCPSAAMQPRTVGMALGIATAGDHLGAFVGTVALGAIVESAGNDWLAAVPAMAVFAVVGVLGAIGFHYFMKKRAAQAFTAEPAEA